MDKDKEEGENRNKKIVLFWKLTHFRQNFKASQKRKKKVSIQKNSTFNSIVIALLYY